MKKLLIMMLLLISALASFGQERLISGAIVDRDTQDPIGDVTVQLLKADSTYVTGAISDNNGLFSIKAPANEKYLLKITSVGYKNTVKRIQMVDDKNLAMGKVVLNADAIMLKAATVTAVAKKVVVKEDTFVYNSSAYRTPEGSTIEELVKRLPGAEVSDDGTIKINGKEVKKILVDGKEFMTGDTKTALKNLPTSIIEKIKAYDQKSDLSRVTGIDDGEEQTVLDFGVKRGMNRGMFSNIDLGLGTQSRYSARGMAAYFNDNNRLMLFASGNNTNDMGFPGGGPGGGRGPGRQGLNASKMVGLNYNYQKKNKLELDASLRWNHSDGDSYTRVSSENFVSTTPSFSNSRSSSMSRSNSWDGRLRLEWKPDTLTNIMFRPSFTISSSDGLSRSLSAQYRANPYNYVTSPLEDDALAKMQAIDSLVNKQTGSSISFSDSKSVKGMVQFNRRLNSMGRNFTLRADASYSRSDSKSLSLNNTYLYLMKKVSGEDSTYNTYRYNTTPSDKYSYSLQATYSEPLWRATFLQLSYKFTYNYTKSDRSTYDFASLSPETATTWGGLSPAYRDWDNYLTRLDGRDLSSYLSNNLSRYSEYRNYIHEIQLMMRIVRSKYNLNFGVMLQPQRSSYLQDYQGKHVDTVRTVLNFSPTLDFRYRFNKVSNLRINYRGTTSQPSMSDLLDITDDSNSLNIKKGNPGLKPSFTNNFRLFYNTYVEKRQQALMTFVNFSTTRNSISDKVTYNETTGGRTTQPDNINGNWSADGAFMYNTSLDSVGVWSINTFTNLRYSNSVAFLSLDGKDSQKNTTKQTTVGERMGISYRNSWLEVNLNGSLNYTHGRNQLQPSSNMDTWQFSYGPSITLTAPWGTSLSTDLSNSSRRGYSDSSMNTDELVWNAQVSQGFLKGKPLTVMLQFYDILKQQSTLSRSLTAMARTDTEYNSINSYAMLHVIYRMNFFGGKDARRGGPGGDGPRPDMGGRPFGGGRPPMGPPPGGGRF